MCKRHHPPISFPPLVNSKGAKGRIKARMEGGGGGTYHRLGLVSLVAMVGVHQEWDKGKQAGSLEEREDSVPFGQASETCKGSYPLGRQVYESGAQRRLGWRRNWVNRELKP